MGRLAAIIARLWWRSLYLLSEHHDCSGYPIAIFLPQRGEGLVIQRKIANALELLRVHCPRHFDRVRAHSNAILVFGETGPLGEWIRAARLIELNSTFVLADDSQPEHVAATIVHEATHAWLEHHGFAYAASRRRRLEAICYRSEAAFARRLPGGEPLAAYYDKCADTVLEQGDDFWSNDAFRQRSVDQLRELGTPEWLIRAVTSLSTMLPNKR